MKLTVRTDMGDFCSKEQDATPDELAAVKDVLQQMVNKATHLTLDTETGFIIVPVEMLKRSIIIVT